MSRCDSFVSWLLAGTLVLSVFLLCQSECVADDSGDVNLITVFDGETVTNGEQVASSRIWGVAYKPRGLFSVQVTVTGAASSTVTSFYYQVSNNSSNWYTPVNGGIATNLVNGSSVLYSFSPPLAGYYRLVMEGTGATSYVSAWMALQ